ncbi:MAG: RNase adapter RapZ [Aliishimia sp.]
MTNDPRRVVLITGPSGAGLSTATDALEDAGFEAIDNLPLRLVMPLLDQTDGDRPMSLGLDMRNRDFSSQRFLELVSDLGECDHIDLQLLYLECRPEEILRRYSSTRRRHPIVQAPTLQDAIRYEIDLLRPLRSRADVLVDTSELNPHELRGEIEKLFAPEAQQQTMVQVHSFSYKRGLPRSVDVVFDCRFLQNPHWQEGLRPLDGRNVLVQDFVTQDARFEEFFEKVREMALFLIPAARDEGKSYLTIAFGCTGGRHRSVTLAERLSQALAKSGHQVSIRHRELDRQNSQEAP